MRCVGLELTPREALASRLPHQGDSAVKLSLRAGKVQTITLAELFQGKRPRIPRIDAAATFRAAAREKTNAQGQLL